MTNLPAVIHLKNQETRDGPIIVTLVTNEDVASQFREVLSQIVSNLNRGASCLTNSNLNTYSYYGADMYNPENMKERFYFSFWSENGPVKTFDKRTSDSQYILTSARFYENGGLEEFRVNSVKHEEIVFNPDGGVNYYRWKPENKIEINLKLDEAGNLKIRGFIIKK
jgi:hypothetical protein